jgi:hypothetical protein
MAPTQEEEFKGDKRLASPQTRNSGYLNLSPEDVIWSFIVSGKCCLVTATL